MRRRRWERGRGVKGMGAEASSETQGVGEGGGEPWVSEDGAEAEGKTQK